MIENRQVNLSVFALEKSQKSLLKKIFLKIKKLNQKLNFNRWSIQEELNDSSKDWMKKSDFISSLYNNLEDYSELDINLSANLIKKIIENLKKEIELKSEVSDPFL